MFSITVLVRDFVKCDFLLEAVLSCFDTASKSKMKSCMSARDRRQEPVHGSREVCTSRTSIMMLCIIVYEQEKWSKQKRRELLVCENSIMMGRWSFYHSLCGIKVLKPCIACSPLAYSYMSHACSWECFSCICLQLELSQLCVLLGWLVIKSVAAR
jgi:hypothetical protein